MRRHVTIQTRIGPVPCRISGQGTPVVAAHGLLTDGRLWDRVAGELGPTTMLIAPDLPLGAHTAPVPDRTRLSAENVAGALLDVLDHLGHDQAFAVGCDTGGALLQIAAAAHPDRFSGLVLCSCDALTHFPPPLLRPLRPIAGIPGLMSLVGWVFSLRPAFARPGPFNLLCRKPVDESLVRAWLEPFRAQPGVRADLAAYFKTQHRDLTLRAAERLKSFRGPVIIAWSRQDRLFPAGDAEELASLIPNAELHWIEDALTFSPLDQPGQVASAITRVIEASK